MLAGRIEYNSKSAMGLRDLVHILVSRSKALLAKRHTAGADSYMHWPVLRELVQRSGHGNSELQSTLPAE